MTDKVDMENISEVVKAFLVYVKVDDISKLTEKALYRMLMIAYAQGEGAAVNKSLAAHKGPVQ